MPFDDFRFRNTLYLCLFGIVLVAVNIFFDFDLFERFVGFVHQYEEYDIDEFILISIPLMTGLLIDLMNEKHRKKRIVEAERLKALKATMHTVHDINNNFLNNLQHFITEAKEHKQLSDDSIKEINQLIFETADKLKRLGNINHTKETNYAAGIKGIDYKQDE